MHTTDSTLRNQNSRKAQPDLHCNVEEVQNYKHAPRTVGTLIGVKNIFAGRTSLER
jgi:hypothetical protein